MNDSSANKKRLDEKIKVWPEMVIKEALSAIIVTIVLLLMSMFIDAPLESIANPSLSANPSKAPWYFLGLQELLVYFPPWIAGVLIPTCIILGLAFIPYIDVKRNAKTENAYFALEKTIRIVFTSGMALWILLTITGVFLRGPNWRLQWPDGTPLGANSPVMPLDWLAPTIAACYILPVIFRLKRLRKNIQNVGLMRLLLSHAMVLGGLVVIIQIVLHSLLSFH